MRRDPDDFTIGQLAQLTGVNAKVIRYYEAIGVLPPPQRGTNQYRRYGSADCARLHLLRRIRHLGASLADIKTLLTGSDTARCAEVQRRLLAVITQRLAAIDQEMGALAALRAEVQQYRQAIVACPPTSTAPFSTCTDGRCIGLTSLKENPYDDDAHLCCV